MKTYLEMNEKVANILRHGGKIEQYAAQYIEELRKENAELKYRAEVAERALKNACVRLNSDDGILCSFEMGYGWFCPHIKTSCEECYVEWFIKQAEKELSEETK